MTNILLLFLSLNSFASLDCANVDLNQLSDDKISEYTHCFKDAKVTITESLKNSNKLEFTCVCDRSVPVKIELEKIFKNSCEQITKDMMSAYDKTFILENKDYHEPKQGDFSGMYRLKRLSLLNCKVEKLPASIFDDLINLNGLIIDHSNIKELPVNIFNKLLNLKSLHIGNSAIRTLPDGVFDSLIHLKHLTLSRNIMNDIPIKIFDKLLKLTHLNLGKNDIKYLSQPIFSNPNNSLEYLNLQGNPLSHVYNNAFKNMSQLKELNLFGTNLYLIGNNVFTPLKSLEILNLSYISSDISLLNKEANEQLISFHDISPDQFTRRSPFPIKTLYIQTLEQNNHKAFIDQLVKKGVDVVY